MSNRALRKVRKEEDVEEFVQTMHESGSEEELEEKIPSNPFEMLVEDDVPEMESSQKNLANSSLNGDSKYANSLEFRNQKAAKKKKKKLKSRETQVRKGEQMEDIDDLIKKYSTVNIDTSSSEKEGQNCLFQIDPKYLNAEYEERKRFGSRTVNQVQRDNRRRKSQYKKMLLIQPMAHWPPLRSGLTMEFKKSLDGHNFFQFKWSEYYKELQNQFFSAVQTHDPQSLQIILQQFPYHVDSLLQLSEVCKQTGDLEMAKDLVDRAIFYLESVWHHLFSPVHTNCKLDYKDEENKTFFLALFRKIQLLGREGCSRTALEYCKLLLNFDETDPLFVLFIIDTFCMRSEEYQLLVDIYNSQQLHEKVYLLPNFCFSVSLAMYHLEKKGKGKESQSSDSMLQQSLMLFPVMLHPLVDKCSISITFIDEKKNRKNPSDHWFFNNSKAPSSVEKLVKLYVEMNFNLWKNGEVVDWLKKNALHVVQRAESKDPMIENYSAILKEEFSQSTENIYNHFLLSEHTASIGNLPPELLREDGGAQIYENYDPTPTIHANTTNSLLLFLQTLFSPDPPNAPPEQ